MQFRGGVRTKRFRLYGEEDNLKDGISQNKKHGKVVHSYLLCLETLTLFSCTALVGSNNGSPTFPFLALLQHQTATRPRATWPNREWHPA